MESEDSDSSLTPNGQLYVTKKITQVIKPRPKKNVNTDGVPATQSNVNRKPRSPFPTRTVVEKELLIAAVSRKPDIWKKDKDSYHNRDNVSQCWETVSSEVSIPAEECKILWKNLRDAFAARLRKIKAGKSGDGLADVAAGQKARQWIFFDQMKFLEDTLTFRATDSNFEMAFGSTNDTGITTETSVDSDYSLLASPQSDNGTNRKRTNNDLFLDKLGKHMEAVGQALAEPTPTVPNEGFLQYLSGILLSVPPGKKRKCEQDILIIANSYADGKYNLQIVEIETE